MLNPKEQHQESECDFTGKSHNGNGSLQFYVNVDHFKKKPSEKICENTDSKTVKKRFEGATLISTEYRKNLERT